MRVLYLSRTYTTHDRRFLEALAQRHEAFHLPLERPEVEYEARGLPSGVRGLDWGSGFGAVASLESCIARVPRFEEIVEEIQPDIVHAGPVQTCGLVAALAGRRPLVVMSWGSDMLVDADRDPVWNWATRFTLRAADWFVCDCQAVRDKLHLLVPFDDSRITQFPWGTDVRRFHPVGAPSELRRELGWESASVVLSTRSWEPIYGIDVLLRAFRAAFSSDGSMRLLLLGGGSQEPQIEEYIRENGLAEVVHRPGVVSQQKLPEFFRAADVYLSTTYSDGTSVSLLEALASGLPVVVTDGPGNREWVRPDVNGWLATPGDADDFRRGLEAAVALGPAARGEMAHANREVAESRADWSANVLRLLEAYEVLERGRA